MNYGIVRVATTDGLKLELGDHEPSTRQYYDLREYLIILYQLVLIKWLHEQGKDIQVESEEEADSRALVPVQKNSMEVKLDALVGAVKALSLVMGAGVVVRAMYVMKQLSVS